MQPFNGNRLPDRQRARHLRLGPARLQQRHLQRTSGRARYLEHPKESPHRHLQLLLPGPSLHAGQLPGGQLGSALAAAARISDQPPPGKAATTVSRSSLTSPPKSVRTATDAVDTRLSISAYSVSP